MATVWWQQCGNGRVVRSLLVMSLGLLMLSEMARGSDSVECSVPSWYPHASLAADVQLAERVDEMIADGQADEAVGRLRRALSPTVLGDAGRYWDAPHELLRRGLGRALLKASPTICPDRSACRASALAQFVAAERIRRNVDPLRAFVPPDAIELRDDVAWEPPEQSGESTALSPSPTSPSFSHTNMKSPCAHQPAVSSRLCSSGLASALRRGTDRAFSTFPAGKER